MQLQLDAFSVRWADPVLRRAGPVFRRAELGALVERWQNDALLPETPEYEDKSGWFENW